MPPPVCYTRGVTQPASALLWDPYSLQVYIVLIYNRVCLDLKRFPYPNLKTVTILFFALLNLLFFLIVG